MRKTFTTLLFVTCALLLTYTTQAQDEPQELSIYVKALNKYAEWINKFEPEIDTLYFEELRGITTLFPKEVDGLTIEVITAQNQKEIYLEHDGRLIHRKMTPARVIKNEIEIGIIPYRGRLDANRGVILALRGWNAVIFAYDPKTQRFEYNRFENR